MSEWRVSFIIPVLNGEQHIGRVLASMEREMEAEDEIIVVDNGSTDRTIEIAGKCTRAIVIRDQDATIAGLRNLGASRAEGNLLAFIDSDCLLAPGWRANTIEATTRLNAGAVGSRVGIPTDASWIERAWQSMRSAEERPVSFINSANLIVSAEAFASIGGFDQQLVTNEDVDIGFRLNEANWKVWEIPAIRVENLGVPTSIGQFFRQRKWHFVHAPQIISAGKIDFANTMTYAVLLSWAAAFVTAILAALEGLSICWPVGLVIWGPIAATIYRVAQFRGWRYFFHLIVLHAVFFLARAAALVQIMGGQRQREWRR